MFQTIVVILLFAASLFYVSRMIVRNFTRKNSCSSGCGKCGIDFNKIEQELTARK